MYFKQIQEIIDGTKTQTRRIVKPGERFLFDDDDHEHIVLDPNNRLKWQVGRDYAVSPGRGLPGVLWQPGYNTYYMRHEGIWIPSMWKGDIYVPDYTRYELERKGWEPLRIVITAIRREALQDISPEDVRAEGIWCDVDHDPLDIGFSRDLHNQDVYRQLWNDINTRKGTRWEDNPDVWVIEFEVVRDAS